jgi:Ni,Fe-hydrogenase III small subunit
MLTGSFGSKWAAGGASLVLVAVSLFIVLLAENSRIPFDDPNTHLELTMIHEVMVLDHSGPSLGMILYGAAIKLFVFGSVSIRVLMPWDSGNAWVDWGGVIVSMMVIAVLIGVVESTDRCGVLPLLHARRLFAHSLKLRQVSAGGCNGCEADVNVLNTIVFDLGRFGTQFVASPRHADGLLITGPVTENMQFALKKTYDAVPSPKIVIAVGACAISGGPYVDHAETHNGADFIVPVDLYIPGCPPHPFTILDGLLRLLGKLEEAQSNRA